MSNKPGTLLAVTDTVELAVQRVEDRAAVKHRLSEIFAYCSRAEVKAAMGAFLEIYEEWTDEVAAWWERTAGGDSPDDVNRKGT
jgi:hypothetical protein